MGKILNVLLVGCVLAFVGCGGQPPSSSSSEESEAPATEKQKVGTCDCSGYWYCPTDGWEYWYDPPQCGGGPTVVSAGSACNSHCPANCINAGWQCS